MFMLTVVVVFRISLVNSVTTESTTTSTTTTPSPTTTTAAPTTTTASPIVPSNTDIAYCTCNLKWNECDVNCCCDPDCTSSDLLSFSSCTDQWTPPINTKACIQSSTVFKNNTPYKVEVTQSGLFCVYYDNNESANYYNPPTLVTDTSTFDYYMSRYGSYSYQETTMSDGVPKTDNTQYYISGDPILVVYNTDSLGNGTLGMLPLPAPSGSSEYCLNTNPAAYLYSQTNICIQPISKENLATQCTNNTMLDPETYYANFKIVTTPAILYANGSNGTELPTVPLYDSPDLISITTNGSILQPHYSDNVCFYAVVQVTYNIAYNGTSGITSASVQFVYGNLTTVTLPDVYTNVSSVPLKQTFKTNFYQTGKSDNVPAFSGNPGYLVGEPVRAGTNETNGGSQAINLNADRTQWLTMVASQSNGLCVDSVQDRVPVRFGVNMRSGCFIGVSYNNMSSLCAESQASAIRALVGNPLPSNTQTYVAVFGNSSTASFDQWLPIQQTILDLPSVQQPCSLNYSFKNEPPGQCMSIITGMNLQIIYANAGAINNPQPAIIGAEYQFICQKVLNFQCVGPYCQPSNVNTTSQKFEISSSVNFVDASSPPVGAYGQIPTSTSTLPADFFYPFS